MESGSSDDQFIEEYRPLVRSIAHKIRNSLDLTCDLDDLIAFGFHGLVEARGRFDASRGVQFNTFAYYRIRGAILDGVRKMAYLPRRAHQRLRAAEAADRVAEDTGDGRAADPGKRNDLAATADAIAETLHKMTAAFVMSAVGQGDDDVPSSPEEALIAEEQSARVRRALEGLDERELALVKGFYFDGRRFDEVAAELGISKSWASRIHTKALADLKKALGSG